MERTKNTRTSPWPHSLRAKRAKLCTQAVVLVNFVRSTTIPTRTPAWVHGKVATTPENHNTLKDYLQLIIEMSSSMVYALLPLE